jgi:hypothetical protein
MDPALDEEEGDEDDGSDGESAEAAMAADVQLPLRVSVKLTGGSTAPCPTCPAW